MKYTHLASASGDGAPAPAVVLASGAARGLHRLPPVLRVLAPTDPNVSRHLVNAAFQTHLDGGDAHTVCAAVYTTALRLGYRATINTHDVVAGGMPSYPGQRVQTTLVLVDLVPA